MDIRDYFRIFGRWWTVIVGLTLVGVALGFATTFKFVNQYLPDMFSTDYQSTVSMFVATQNGTSVSEAYQNSQFSMDRALSYAGLATSEQVAQRAIDQLKSPIGAGDLRSRITAAPRPKTVLLDVNVRDADPAQAQTYAAAVGDQMVGLVSELETSRRGGTPAAGVVVIDEANYPTAEIGWKLWKRLLLGGAVGLLLGLVAAIAVGAADRRLRGREGVAQALDEPVLAGLPEDGSRAKVAVVDLGSESLYAEKIRELRTCMRFAVPAGHEGPPRTIAITSPTMEEGRTTTAIDLAAALAESGKSVVLVDADMRHSAIAERLSLTNPNGAALLGLSTALAGEHGVAEALFTDVPVGDQSIAVLPAGPRPPRPGELWATDRAGEVVDELERNFDYVIFDTPPLATYTDGAIVAAFSDGALLLARIQSTTGAALRQALQVLESADAPVLGTVATFERIGLVRKMRRRKQLKHDVESVEVTADADGSIWEPAEDAVDPTTNGRLVGAGRDARASRHGRE